MKAIIHTSLKLFQLCQMNEVAVDFFCLLGFLLQEAHLNIFIFKKYIFNVITVCIFYILKTRNLCCCSWGSWGHPAEQWDVGTRRGCGIRPTVSDTNYIMARVKQVNIQVSVLLNERIRLGTMDYKRLMAIKLIAIKSKVKLRSLITRNATSCRYFMCHAILLEHSVTIFSFLRGRSLKSLV